MAETYVSLNENCQQQNDEAHESDPERHHVQERKGHIFRPDLNRQKIVAKATLGRRRQHEENHEGSVHRHQRKVKLAGHYSARSAGRKQRAHDGPMSSRPAQVHAHQHRHDHADDHGAQRQQDILNADHFVIEAEDVFANETLRRLVTMHNVVSCFCHRVLLQIKAQYCGS